MENISATYAAWVSALGTWAAIIGAALFIWRQNRKAKELTCLQLYLKISSLYDSNEMNIRRARLATELFNKPETVEIDDSILVFFENVGLLVERGLLDFELVNNVFGLDIEYYWVALDHYVENLRITLDDESLYKSFQTLKDKIIEDRLEVRLKENKGNLNYEDFKNIFLQMEMRRDFNDLKTLISNPKSSPKKTRTKATNKVN